MDDKEIKAIADILASLEGLDSQAKNRVFKYVAERMGIQGMTLEPLRVTDYVPAAQGDDHISGAEKSFSNIRSLKEEKRPDTAIQMAALVAYYLKEIASGEERKESIDVKDIEKYFVQANFPLPKIPVTALTNAKSAGYLESADREDIN